MNQQVAVESVATSDVSDFPDYSTLWLRESTYF